jgi:hypothetical protein
LNAFPVFLDSLRKDRFRLVFLLLFRSGCKGKTLFDPHKLFKEKSEKKIQALTFLAKGLQRYNLNSIPQNLSRNPLTLFSI